MSSTTPGSAPEPSAPRSRWRADAPKDAGPAGASVPTGSWINARTRRAALDEVDRSADHPFDVAVVGGGITGVGVALDAASRGLRVALIEARDLGAGTSGWSSKLVHGGLRYLAKGDVGLAKESAAERHLLMTTIAPHLVHPVQFLIPLGHNISAGQRLLTATGLRLGDVLRRTRKTPSEVLPPPRSISAFEAQLLAPGLSPDGLRGGLVYWDGQLEDDVRLVLAVARTAAAHGARIITRARASAITDSSVTFVDDLTSDQGVLHAKTVVNATGVWAGTLEPSVRITASRGTHLVVRSEQLGDPRAIITVPVPGHFGRYVFALPQPDGLTYIGLTDEPAPEADGYRVDVPVQDERFLLETLNLALRNPLGPGDVIGRYAGLRPLVSGEKAAASADLSRHHLLLDEPNRPLTITGGKLTTYRRMAEATVNAVVERIGKQRACVTAELPLIGAADRGTIDGIAAPERLRRRYGAEAGTLMQLASDDPSLLEPVISGSPVLRIEVVFAVLAEGALSVDDFLDRRVRAGLVPEARERLRWECTKLLDATLATAS